MTDPAIAELASMVAADLVAEDAQAVILAGNQERGDATELSDIDTCNAIGSGPATLVEAAPLLARNPRTRLAGDGNRSRLGPESST